MGLTHAMTQIKLDDIILKTVSSITYYWLIYVLLLAFVPGLHARLYFFPSYEAGFYKLTVLKTYPPICGIVVHVTMLGLLEVFIISFWFQCFKLNEPTVHKKLTSASDYKSYISRLKGVNKFKTIYSKNPLKPFTIVGNPLYFTRLAVQY